MKLKLKNADFESEWNRVQFANQLSCHVEGAGPEAGFRPYCPNENDTWFWTIDSGNDWKVKFFEDDPNAFEIIYRYQCAANQFEEALAGWLKVRMRAEIYE